MELKLVVRAFKAEFKSGVFSEGLVASVGCNQL